MQLHLIIGAFVALVATAVRSDYCDDLPTPVPPCEETSPRDLLFLVDGSNSMDRNRFYGEMLNYCLSLYCAFDPTKNNQAGMIVFNEQITVYIPLAEYTREEWFAQVETVRATKDLPNPACCSCCTPTAEAFDQANLEFSARGKNAIRIAFTITDGLPSNNFANTGGNPAWWFYNKNVGFDPAVYNMQIVPQRANVLKSAGNRIFLVGVPNNVGTPPQAAYFSGKLPQNSKQCVPPRGGKNWCAIYSLPPFPIVSVPVDKNSFSTTTWNVNSLISQTVGALCEILPTQAPTKSPTSKPPTFAPTLSPTKRPTSKNPTNAPTQSPTRKPTSKAPTLSPTLGPTSTPPIEQLDLTFLIDRSRSMLWHNNACKSIVEETPVPGKTEPRSYCWELFMRYVLAQADETVKVKAGKNLDRNLGWASDFPGASNPAKGLRVNIIGFACANKQKTPRIFQYTAELAGGPVTSRAKLVDILETLRTLVLPDGGTCPGFAIEQTVRNIEGTKAADYPLQSVIMVTDGVFYDMPYPVHATTGLEAYKALRFAVGIAVAREDFDYGLTKKEIETQRQQLLAFVGHNPSLFKNLDTDGWEALPQIAAAIASDLPEYYYQGEPIPRYTWCGWRRIQWCKYENWRESHCTWPKKDVNQWGCQLRKSG